MDTKALRKLSYGLYVLTAANAGTPTGCIVNTAVQAASAPSQLSVCVSKENHTHDVIAQTGAFTVSVIDQNADFSLFKRFGFQSGRDTNKFADFADYALDASGLPYVTKGANAYISVKVTKVEDLGSHSMFVGEVVDAAVLGDAPSVTYDYYLQHIKPKPQAVATTSDGQTVWRCTICGYEYVGEELPDDFICPLCKHPASDFEKVVK